MLLERLKSAGRTVAPTTAGPDHQHPRVNEGTSMAEGQSTVEFRDVPRFPGYRVGDDGSVWSCWGLVSLGGRQGTKSVLTETWVQLIPVPLPESGRRYVGLSRDGKRRNRYVAHLVLEAFVGSRPRGLEACHDNGDCTDDRRTNLRWDTHQGNVADKVRHGTHNRGVRHNCAKLSEDDVRAIRRRVAAGESRLSVANDFNVGKQTVVDIVTGRTWRHLDA